MQNVPATDPPETIQDLKSAPQLRVIDRKLELFKSLFKGRDDVFPLYWQNKAGRKGYSPECENKFKEGVCTFPCDRCDNQKFVPPSDNDFKKHFSGRHLMGQYPLLPDETCFWLSADFDDHGGSGLHNPLEDIKAFIDTCDMQDIPVYPERSKSGAGFHGWIFFENAVPAWKARLVILAMLKEAQVVGDDLGQGSFDRLFPNQDALSGKGLGNLIALPFYGKALEQGNSTFLDKEFNSITTDSDIINFMESIERVSEATLERIIVEWGLTKGEPKKKADYTHNGNLDPKDGLKLLEDNCEFIQHCRDDQPNISEPLWYALASNLARFDGGREKFHEFSRLHGEYKAEEADKKIDQALKSSGPITCAKIRELGFNCGTNCKVKAPAGLGAVAKKNKSGKDDIIVTGFQLREISEKSLKALERANKLDGESFYIRSGMLVTLREDEKGSPKIQIVNETVMRGRLTRAANFYKEKKTGERADVPPPLDVTRDILELGRWSFPSLIGVTESPVVRPDGSILSSQGYDPVTKLFYKPRMIIPEIPVNPSKDDISRARNLIEDLISDFPFTNDAGRAGVIAFFLTPLLRSAFPGCVPLAVIDAPEAGTGKTLLTKLCCLIHMGEEGQMMTPPTTEEEWRKAVSTLLLSGENIVVIDNVDFALRSSSLASVLTATGWKDRLLGKNELISIPHLATWACTGNNLKVKGDLKRRCYHIRLDPKQARPWERRGFKHPDLLRWASVNRGELLWALLTMARAWYVAGCPKSDAPRLGSFEDWAEIVGGILALSGVEGFLSNLKDFYDEQDEEYQEWSTLFDEWFKLLGESETTTKDILAKIPVDVLPNELDGVDDKGRLSRKLGNCLSKRADRIFEGLRLEKTKGDTHSKVVGWKLVNLRG